MSTNRQLDDGGSSQGDVYDYYSEPPDAVKPEGRTILLLTIFAILVAISVGYFVLNLLFPGLRDQIEEPAGRRMKKTIPLRIQTLVINHHGRMEARLRWSNDKAKFFQESNQG
ncbi:hypothetical protein MHU86_22330 [Fragilaria crotonensis]|nr:hypothetical protein MHU86_22330 [Fragilaria crotonensis]